MPKITRGLIRSIIDYPLSVARYWYVIAIGGIGQMENIKVALREWLPAMTFPSWLPNVMLLGGVVLAQFLAWHKMKQERDRLRQFNVTHEALTHIGKYRAQLISHQNDQSVKDEITLGQWIEKFHTLKDEIVEYVKTNISPAEASLFERYGNFPVRILGTELQMNGAPHWTQVQKRSMLIRDYEFLEQLVKDYARQRGWREDRFTVLKIAPER